METTLVAEQNSSLASLYEDARSQLGAEPSWLTELRASAWDVFQRKGLPTTKMEDWRFMPLHVLKENDFRLASHGSMDAVPGEWSARLSIVNGRCVEVAGDLPDGAVVCSLREAVERMPDLVERFLAVQTPPSTHAFAALNAALFLDGAFVHIPKGVRIEKPILIAYRSQGAGTANFPRALVIAEESAEAVIVEEFLSSGLTWTSPVTEIFVSPNAHVEHVRLQRESLEAIHLASMGVYIERDAVAASQSISFGGALARLDIGAKLDGENIDCTLNGLYFAGQDQLVGNFTSIDHAMPNCQSHELYKGILDANGKGVFTGKIFVRQDAQKTDAKQTNQALLLSEDAQINSKPQLEIFADDVKCTHGATVGYLEQDPLFYLRSRGIPKRDAESILVFAFANDLVQRIPVESIRDQLESWLFERLKTA
ncbi:MAG: Fe-S cluster assembly protein SufD [Armatimonadetes bacterium]|nr:Fe-S cluster assembly protein SufD [Armatimonadota bacterium]